MMFYSVLEDQKHKVLKQNVNKITWNSKYGTQMEQRVLGFKDVLKMADVQY